MSGDLLNKARRDLKRIVTKGGFQVDIILRTVDGLKEVALKGIASKHWLSLDSDGMPINSKNAHISILESDLVEAGYQVRNQKNEVNLLNHRVIYADSTGNERTYVIKEWMPDETVGLIVCTLGDFNGS